MGQILDCGLTAVGTASSIRIDDDFKETCNQMQVTANVLGNEREMLHAEAILNFAHGNLSMAAKKWEDLISKYPNDMLAVKFGHDTYFYVGIFWHGMCAFGLEKCDDYIEAEKQARKVN
uniref:TPR_REGION domain-containing protein n=1 Tax=Syphacia muris TaxID=451379 RepID=A0A0N5AHN0_9BILA